MAKSRTIISAEKLLLLPVADGGAQWKGKRHSHSFPVALRNFRLQITIKLGKH